jgi:hypothetical protein
MFFANILRDLAIFRSLFSRGGSPSTAYPQQPLQVYAAGCRRFRIEGIVSIDPGTNLALPRSLGHKGEREAGPS